MGGGRVCVQRARAMYRGRAAVGWRARAFPNAKSTRGISRRVERGVFDNVNCSALCPSRTRGVCRLRLECLQDASHGFGVIRRNGQERRPWGRGVVCRGRQRAHGAGGVQTGDVQRAAVTCRGRRWRAEGGGGVQRAVVARRRAESSGRGCGWRRTDMHTAVVACTRRLQRCG